MKPRLIKTIIGCSLLGLAFGAVIVALLKFVDGPVTSTAAIPTVDEARRAAEPTAQPPALLQGLHVVLNYPARLDALAQVKTNNNALEQYNLGSNQDYRQSAMVTVSKAPPDGLNGDSSYRLRQIQSDTYKPSTETVAGSKAIIMRKVDGTEETLFVIAGGKLL